jgi:hypothetical protein
VRGLNLLCTLNNCWKLSTGQEKYETTLPHHDFFFSIYIKFLKKYTHFSYANLLILSVYGTSTLLEVDLFVLVSYCLGAAWLFFFRILIYCLFFEMCIFNTTSVFAFSTARLTWRGLDVACGSTVDLARIGTKFAPLARHMKRHSSWAVEDQ